MLFKRLFSTNRLTVIGSGQMGAGIAFVSLLNGKLPTTIYDVNEKSVTKASDLIKKLLDKQVSKEKIDAKTAEDTLSRLSFSTAFDSAVKSADLVIEAVPEIPDLKLQLFGDLAKTAEKSTILASNTSSISLTKIAAAARGAESRVIGLHFFNPVPVLKGAEVIRALQTSDEVHSAAVNFMTKVGKVPSSSLDAPGFLANRILVPMINEAVLLFENGVGSAADIDSIMKNGCGMPMGPLALADLIGIDTVLAIMEVLLKETGDSKFRPANSLRNYASAGYLGKKSGRGFYEY